jgi:hypothetical protein
MALERRSAPRLACVQDRELQESLCRIPSNSLIRPSDLPGSCEHAATIWRMGPEGLMERSTDGYVAVQTIVPVIEARGPLLRVVGL